MDQNAPQTSARSPQQYAARAKVAKALAHPSRLFMLDLLGQRDLCVQELTQKVGADQSTVSKHLAVLRDAGLIESRREGTSNYYRVTCGCLDDFFRCLEAAVKPETETDSSVACDEGCST